MSMFSIEYSGPVALIVGAFFVAALIALVEWGASALRRRRQRRTWGFSSLHRRWHDASHNPNHFRR